MKDHIIAAVVNDLRDTAIKFHDTQQLRERLRGCIEPLLSAAAPQVVADERSIKTWIERAQEQGHYEVIRPGQSISHMEAEIADLRAALTAAPVQPVAVPDDYAVLVKALKDIAESCNCCGDRLDLAKIANDALGDYELCPQAQFKMMNHRLKKIFAAPAAQGDALIESNLREIIAKTSDDYARYVARTTLAAIAAKAAS